MRTTYDEGGRSIESIARRLNDAGHGEDEGWPTSTATQRRAVRGPVQRSSIDRSQVRSQSNSSKGRLGDVDMAAGSSTRAMPFEASAANIIHGEIV